MSRIGRMPISLPSNVEVTLGEGNLVTVKGPKGTLTQKLSDKMTITKEENVIHVTRPNDAKENRALHGLTRTLLNNMIVGVTDGFSKELEVTQAYLTIQKLLRFNLCRRHRAADQHKIRLIHIRNTVLIIDLHTGFLQLILGSAGNSSEIFEHIAVLFS